MFVLDEIGPGSRSITLAFLACGCQTIYDGRDTHANDRVRCPNQAAGDGHGGWTTITQTLTGTLQPSTQGITA